MSNLQIITTRDGSHSLINTDLNETYHSNHGAIQESVHVFIKSGLDYFTTVQRSVSPLNILEIGFGTGLNALLTLQYSTANKIAIDYCTIEAFPVAGEIIHSLNYASDEQQRKDFSNLHECLWNRSVLMNEFFSISKLHSNLQDVNFGHRKNHIVYYDAFAPNKQPEMWTLSLLEKVCRTLMPGGVFVTYCAKGQLKRDLKSLGLKVETLPGPPGKKEMVRATLTVKEVDEG